MDNMLNFTTSTHVDRLMPKKFAWAGKNAACVEAAAPTTKTLRPVVEDSVDWGTTKNVYIEDNNLKVLKLLQHSYMGKVKMIYMADKSPLLVLFRDACFRKTFRKSTSTSSSSKPWIGPMMMHSKISE